jgi:hypothetical protein
MSAPDPLSRLFAALHREGVEYVLVGGQAVRFNGFLRATEDVGVLVAGTRDNGERVKRALAFLPSSADIDPAWFVPAANGEIENIRVADDILVDLLFSANGQSYEMLKPHIRVLALDGVPVRVVDIAGLLKTKTEYREKDILDRQVLTKIQQELAHRGQDR